MDPLAIKWSELARECLRAAGLCLREKCDRSAANRAYYAMFAATTAALRAEGQQPREQQGTWSHGQIPKLIVTSLKTRVGLTGAREIRRLVWRAYYQRIVADYRPGLSIERSAAQRVVLDAAAVLRELRISL